MVQVSRRAGLTDSALVRLLARLSQIDVPESREPFAQRLSHWLGWADAISLAGALNAQTACAPGTAVHASGGGTVDDACERLRAAQAAAIAQDVRSVAQDPQAEFAAWRRRYATRQQAMETGCAALREHLRAALAARSADMARLAALDAVMAQVLGLQQHKLLAQIPGHMERHFERLQRASEQAKAAHPSSAPPPTHWQNTFSRDFHQVLLAELELRLQPARGLLEALRTTPP